MYREDIARIGHEYAPGEKWNAFAEFMRRLVEEYYPEEHHRRSYRRSDGGNMFYEREDMIPGHEHSRYRGQPRTSSGRFKSRYGRHSDIESGKEEVGAMLAHTHGREWIIEKAIKEASEFIQAATKEDEYEMFKEFSELCILMQGAAEFIPADLEEEACRKALEYYSRKAETMRYSNPLLDEYARMNRMHY